MKAVHRTSSEDLPAIRRAAEGERSTMPSLVLDTNAVLDWLVFDDAAMLPVGRAIEDSQCRWLACPMMRCELEHVLGRGLKARADASAERVWQTFSRFAQLRPDPRPEPSAGPLQCRDPDDQKFIDLALEHDARWLLTRDRALLALARRALAHGLLVSTPACWQDAMGRQP